MEQSGSETTECPISSLLTGSETSSLKEALKEALAGGTRRSETHPSGSRDADDDKFVKEIRSSGSLILFISLLRSSILYKFIKVINYILYKNHFYLK